MTHQEIIDKFLKPYLNKARNMMRKGSYDFTPLKVSDDISAEYLDNLFALRYKENLKLWTIQFDDEKED